jgi:hypothetical protein
VFVFFNLQLGLGSDPSVDLGFGLNLGRLCGSNSNGNQVQSAQSNNGTSNSGSMGEATNLEIMQRINAMLENSLDLTNLTGEVASKRNYTGNSLFYFMLVMALIVPSFRLLVYVRFILRV